MNSSFKFSNKNILYVYLILINISYILNITAAEEDDGLIVSKSYNKYRLPTRRKKIKADLIPAVTTVPTLHRRIHIQGLPGPPLPNGAINGYSKIDEGIPAIWESQGLPIIPKVENGTEETKIKSENGEPVLSTMGENDEHEMEAAKGFGVVYNTEEAEQGEPELLKVDVAIQIQSVREIDEADQKIILELDLTVHWKDYTLLPEDYSYVVPEREDLSKLLRDYEVKPIALSEFEKLWKPDIFIERVEKVTKPGLLSSPITVRAIKEPSSLVYTTRASVKMDCNMDFAYYPADTQNCFVDIRSYQNDDKSLSLRWNPLPGAYLVNPDTDDNFDVQLEKVLQRKKRIKDISLQNATYDVLQMKISMRRKMSYHVIQTYIPSAFLVFITWLSFFIPEDMIEARIGISMTTLLTLTAMFSAVRENTPIVSYVKAIDVWMVYCIFIVFTTLLEFTFFVWLRNYKTKNRQKEIHNILNSSEGYRDKINDKNLQRHSIGIDELTAKASVAFDRTSRLFNRFAFLFFVLNFVIFNIVYWPWLFLSSEYWSWKINNQLNGDPEDKDIGFIDEL